MVNTKYLCHSCCVYLEYSMPRLYSAFLGSNRPTADSFAWGPAQMDLEYSGDHRKSLLFIFPLCAPLNVSIAVRGDIFATRSAS